MERANPLVADVSRLPAAKIYAESESYGARMRAVNDVITRVAATDATVLVWGESGVGKERVAHLVHQRSSRAQRPLVKLNCAALPLELLESELFGYERGAFTGAHRPKPGKFELADNGTILLDEIGELPLPLQAKLLQVLQDGEFSRLGSRGDIRVDVRVIAMTNRDLAKLVELGQFREDLYYRINVVNIHVPPLRDRREEIPMLVEEFTNLYAQHYGRAARPLSAATMQRFMEYSWPGNIRELENLVKRTVVLESEDWQTDELRDGVARSNGVSASSNLSNDGPPNGTTHPFDTDDIGLKEIGRQAARMAERAALERTLGRVHWRRKEAARRLKISYTALLYKMKEHGLGR